ncbi:nitroreductase family protein [Nocardioides sp.]|uniref:nitroreductase family protein n=1 Tax=Nocardioides sp. TaxID=35761 RepID=UPI0027262906|nr:nitroreductase family protein [Nocardioides sp.]MDO9455587.1 nitroreductase family protein [Nocardioides sp.]
MTHLLPLLRDRRSVRAFDPDHVLAATDLSSLLEAARWAPSAGNSQPWAFLVARRGTAFHADYVDLLAASTRRWAPAASALVFSLHQAAYDDGDGLDLAYSDYAAYDLGQAVAHLTVQASHLGLSCHQFAAFDHERLAREAGVPAHWRVTTGIAVGLGVESDVEVRVRRPLADVAHEGRFGNPMSTTLIE